MEQKKVLFIVNPRSGKGLIKNYLLDIVDIFMKGGMDVTIYVTQKTEDAYETVKRRAAEFEQVVCSGGDGTLDEVVTGMMESEKKCPIGYIPAGSTNDFANSLQLPMEMKEAAYSIVSNQPYPCDIGSFNGDYFVYIAAFGIFTDVSYQTNQDAKNILGHLAYVLEGAKRIFNVQSYQIEAEIGEAHVEGEFIFGMVTNSESVGGFRNITGKNVQLDDGVFEVTLIKRPHNAIELQEIIASLLIREMDSKYILTYKASHVKLKADRVIPWTLDGEFGGEHQAVDIQCCRKAISILVNHAPEEANKSIEKN